MPDLVDVVVVGAGLSGLQAACNVHAAGLSVLILEAKDRVGGKTWSRSVATGGTVDLGAAWINDTNQSKMYGLAQRFGLQTITQRVQGNDLHQIPDGSIKIVPFGASREREENPIVLVVSASIGDPSVKHLFQMLDSTFYEEECMLHTRLIAIASARSFTFSEETDKEILDFMEQIDRKGRELDMRDAENYQRHKDLDSITVAEYCKRYAPGDIPIAVADRCIRAWLGVTADELSALFFIDYVRSGRGFAVMRSDKKDGGQYLRIRTGTQSFSKSLAATLPAESILLSHPVSSISQTIDGHCTVSSATRSYSIQCRKVIVSTPTPLYRHIFFDPVLPSYKTDITSHTTLGYYAKTLLIYASPWWRELNLSGVSNSVIGPVGFTRDTCSEDDKQYSLTCFIVAGLGRTWSRLSAAERQAQVLAQIAKMFGTAAPDGPESVPKPVQILEQEWVKEEWIEGAPNPVMALGALSEGGLVRITEPFVSVHFVGTETADVWRGYMEGAVRSGERGANEVIEALGPKL